jgi:hypothetical protein
MCGSDRCPCILSILGECLVCSHLQGKQFCDCHWSGFCVYINFLYNKKISYKIEQDFLVPVRSINIGLSGYHIFLTAPDSVTSKLNPMDSVLLKSRYNQGNDLPAVVLTTYPGHGIVSMAVKPLTAMQKDGFLEPDAFFQCFDHKPAAEYLAQFKRHKYHNLLIVAEGFGQLLVDTLIKRYLLPNNNEVTVILKEYLPVTIRNLENMKVEYRVTGYSNLFLTNTLNENHFDAYYNLSAGLSGRQAAGAKDVLAAGIPLFTSPLEGITKTGVES